MRVRHSDVPARLRNPNSMIQKYRSSLLVTLLCGLSAVSLHAQGPGGGPPRDGGRGEHHGPPPNLLFEALDTNHDGVISAKEMTNASTSLKALLKNGATELKREDLRPPRPAPSTDGAPKDKEHGPRTGGENRPHHGPPPTPLFDALDANHDGTISAAEMDNAPAAIKSLLKNGATELKREDIRPPRPPQDQQG